VTADVHVVTELFACVVDLRGLTGKGKSSLEQSLVEQYVQLCMQLAQCNCSASALKDTKVTGQRRCVLSFVLQCVEIRALGGSADSSDFDKILKEFYMESRASTASGYDVAMLCARLGVEDVGSEFPGIQFPFSGHPLHPKLKPLKERLSCLYSDVKSILPLQQMSTLLCHHAPVDPVELLQALCITEVTLTQQLLTGGVPDLGLLSHDEQDKVAGLLKRMQQRLKDVLAPLTYCWFYAEFKEGFLHELANPEYFIGKTVVPHMTQRVRSWDPAACIQLLMVPSLERVFSLAYGTHSSMHNCKNL